MGAGPGGEDESEIVGRQVFSRTLTHFWVVPGYRAKFLGVISHLSKELVVGAFWSLALQEKLPTANGWVSRLRTAEASCGCCS